MSLHIEAGPGDIAKHVLLPGDPLRTRYIAENFLSDAHCYNKIRGVFGYTGTYKGMRLSVQTHGIGMPSMDLYARELICDYGVDTLIRIGTCGSMLPEIKNRDLVLAMSASTDSAMNTYRLKGTYAPCADYELLSTAYTIGKKQGHTIYCGNVFTTDAFYGADPDDWQNWAAYNVMAVEMETCALYTQAARYRAKALSILTVTDQFADGARLSASERETSLNEMITLGLDTLLAIAQE
ncbi:MAG: purine-nucleoside phosphorylase [Bacillota bacterium]